MTTPVVDTTEETPGKTKVHAKYSNLLILFPDQLQLREEGHARVIHIAGLLPFANLSTYDPEQLLSVANFFKTEIITLQHTILHAHSQYKASLAQLDEINRQRLAKLGIDDSMDVEAIEVSLKGKETVKESQAGPSKSGYVSA